LNISDVGPTVSFLISMEIAIFVREYVFRCVSSFASMSAVGKGLHTLIGMDSGSDDITKVMGELAYSV
jgi:hypothetical protein